MAWDSRGYYYRSIRRGERVDREYLGAGLLANLAALEDEEERTSEQERRIQIHAERARMRQLDTELAAVCDTAEAFARLALLVDGHRQHDRGAWRRRRQKPS